MTRTHNFSGTFRRKSKLFVLITASLLVLFFVVGCASSSGVPIESRSQPPSKKIDTHIVETGDTLYSIAWRYETDYKKLAAINGIRAPYVIRKGQIIKLSGSASRQPAPARSTSTTTVVSTTRVPARTTSVSTTPASTTTASSGSTANKRPVKTPEPTLPDSVQGWNWPLNGKVVKSFGSSDLTRGITIDSSAEKNVKAAAEGVVVYSGSGVRGYGNFLILKHSDLYLSAYAYNSELLTKEGDQVRKGQKIALAGKDLDGKPRLYFEIRKDGKPVDPVRYLPKR